MCHNGSQKFTKNNCMCVEAISVTSHMCVTTRRVRYSVTARRVTSHSVSLTCVSQASHMCITVSLTVRTLPHVCERTDQRLAMSQLPPSPPPPLPFFPSVQCVLGISPLSHTHTGGRRDGPNNGPRVAGPGGQGQAAVMGLHHQPHPYALAQALGPMGAVAGQMRGGMVSPRMVAGQMAAGQMKASMASPRMAAMIPHPWPDHGQGPRGWPP